MNTETAQGTAYSVINYNPTTKEQAESFANKLTEEVLQGEVNPLELHVKLTAMQKAFETVKTNIAKEVLAEAQKHNAPTFKAYTSEISIQELGVKYDFTNCGDLVYADLKKKEEELKMEIKNREAFLKSCKAGTELIDSESGEVYTIYPPAKSSTTGVKVILK